jgi:pimeloyl-ACP methyl ester carboxylesterase
MADPVSVDFLRLDPATVNKLRGAGIHTLPQLATFLAEKKTEAEKILKCGKSTRRKLRAAIKEYRNRNAQDGTATVVTNVIAPGSASMVCPHNTGQPSTGTLAEPSLDSPVLSVERSTRITNGRTTARGKLKNSVPSLVVGGRTLVMASLRCLAQGVSGSFHWLASHKLVTVLVVVILVLVYQRSPLSVSSWLSGRTTTEEVLKQVAGPTPAPGGNIVFVHGLDGSAETTWRNPDTEFDFPVALGEDFSTVGIWVVNYDASSKQRDGNPLPIVDRSRVLLEQLKQRSLQENNLILIGHSLGGLVIKQMLRDASGSTEAGSEEVATRTHGVVFLATPHTGGDQGLVEFASALSFLAQPSRLVNDLQWNNPNLRELNVWYRNYSKKTDTKNKVFFEKAIIPGLRNFVVPENSADPGLDDADPTPAPGADHIMIAKPRGKDDIVYDGVRRFIRTTLEPLGERWDIPYPQFVSEFGDLKRRSVQHPEELADYVKKHSGQRVRWKVKVAEIRNAGNVRNFRLAFADGQVTPDQTKKARDQWNLAGFSRWAFRPDIKVGDSVEIEGAVDPKSSTGGVFLKECKVLNPPSP